MDWFSWLSKTGIDPSLIYEYGVSFAQNELEEDDIPYFDHEFLQSMGISIAKHRLEILKLSQKQNSNFKSPTVSKLLIAIKRTKRRFSKYLRACTRREESALALVPWRSYSAGWKNSKMKRNKRLIGAGNQSRKSLLQITNGGPSLFSSSRINSFSYPFERDEKSYFDEYWSYKVEETRESTSFNLSGGIDVLFNDHITYSTKSSLGGLNTAL